MKSILQAEEIGRIAHEKGIWFHTDAVQAYGHEKIDVEKLNIDLLSASGHKLNGPKGIGILYIRNSVKIGALIHGGALRKVLNLDIALLCCKAGRISFILIM